MTKEKQERLFSDLADLSADITGLLDSVENFIASSGCSEELALSALRLITLRAIREKLDAFEDWSLAQAAKQPEELILSDIEKEHT